MSTDWAAIEYRPVVPDSDVEVAMVGCGGIATVAARAYSAAGVQVTALCDLNRAAAELMRDEHFPEARVFGDLAELLDESRADIVDIATHTAVRGPLVRQALEAGRHVQSQKPFVLDLALGEELCDLADERGVLLAVNQNGRWSPHFAYLLAAARSGALGEIEAASFDVAWDHDSAVVGTPFAELDDLVLLDFGIHWFDLLGALFGDASADRVVATATTTSSQRAAVPMLASAILEYPGASAALRFHAAARRAEEGRYRVDGAAATIRSVGPALGGPDLVVTDDDGDHPIRLHGSWMPDALAGTMGELIGAIVENRTPTTSARRVLAGLRTCLAATESARTGTPVTITPHHPPRKDHETNAR